MALRFCSSTLIARCASAAALLAVCMHAWGDDPFPRKEIHFIVPWNAGGSNDIAARALVPLLAARCSTVTGSPDRSPH